MRPCYGRLPDGRRILIIDTLQNNPIVCNGTEGATASVNPTIIIPPCIFLHILN